ncbi:restriction endonuclease subunit S [Gordonia sp. (in: high G+C Gram-positive bacteria)]|uniref:restriction endonuclease subunit S n=1 Tax=Gordonia sp. (in: high G+C Gram-positive bacteria) TaxID=84139 RepID=UPI003C74021B
MSLTGWTETTVGQASEFLTGFPFPSSAFAETGIRLIRGSNVKRGVIDWSSDIARYWSDHDSSLRAFVLRDGDIVIAMDGALVGRSFARITEAELPAYLVQRVARLRGKAIDQDLLYQWIGSRDFVKHVDDVKTHTAIPHISPRDIRDFKISMPKDPNEQRAVSVALRDADDLITTLERLITKKQAIKQGMMQQLLTGRTRFPGFTEPWSEVSIYQLANNQRTLFNDGDWVESEHITTAGNRLLQTGNVGVGRLLDRGTKRYVSDESFSTLKCKEVVPGDILICRLAEPAGRACIVKDIGERRMLTSVDVSIYRPDPGLADRRFLVAAFSTPGWFQEVSERCGGSTRTRIARSELGRIRIPLPSLEEQKRIADVFTDADDELDTLEARLTKARAVKTGMMKQLLTGRTRLPLETAS